MDVDNEHSDAGSQRQPSAEHTPQGASAQVGGASSQGNPTPTSAQSSNTPSTASGPATANVTHTQNSKRRRGLGVVTPNACTECRKKRAKCDGKKPCGRCRAQKDTECVYEIPVRQSKENLRNEIETLRQKQRSSDQVFAALVRPELWEEVLTRLRGGQPIETISEWLASAPERSIPSFPSRSEGPTMGPNPGFPGGSLGTLAAMSLGANHQPSQQSSMRPEMGQHSPWQSSFSQTGSTRSNSHPDVMNWQTDMRGPPQNRVGSWAEGMNPDQISDGLPRYRGVEQILSPLNEPELQTLSSTWTVITGDSVLVQHLLALYFCWEYPTFASLSKEHFLQDFQEGRNRYCSPILVNALLALGCRFSTQPMSRANPNDPYTSGDHFFKESLRLFAQETDHHSLTTIQALGIMSIREASCGRDSESWYYAGQSIRLAIEMGLHRIMDEGDEDELAVQSATFWGAFALDHAWSLATGSLPQCSCFPHLPPKPAIIGDIEASLWVPYTDDARELLNMYTQYLNCCAVRSVSPRDVCSQAADAIQGLLRSYSSLYTLRRTPSFVPYFVLTSAIMHLAIGATTVGGSGATEADMEKAVKVDPRVAESITQGISDLTEMAPCHQFAEQALNILRYLAAKWDIDVENKVDKLTAEEYDRLVLPHTGSLNFFSPNLREGDITCQWGAGPFLGEQSPSVQKTGDNMENPLFWPFPMQGRPILPDGVELEHAGFAII
ncbi:nitrogen assimilation transcription factor nit-4 [Fusarium tjaetaba]|uniref:Nitrogen assimilation transcription factor nit-4 n=1 Tax=Fusarium tjaetaba TaxID=1567544 RepID=A0A8H5QJ52_9HYPO|nr:nitrogen assimilation transcription factor nit-4 [Fusarium tjaetaba]KAF5615674.1 nitrogen assimilation transcription factor nit-4 [Fusarium tjaetaba]